MEADPRRRREGRLERLPPALRHRDFRFLWSALLAEGLGAQMAVVAVGWQVFEIRHSPLDLGLIGLAEFAPLPLLALPAGHLADRFPRRLLFAGATAVTILVALGLLLVSLNGADELWPFIVLAFAVGCANAVAVPPGRALPATVVPFDLIANAMALRSIAFQAAMIVGPAIGGLLFTIAPEAVYGAAALLLTIGFVCIILIREPPIEQMGEAAADLDTVLAGIRFIRRTPILLGAISLDLFAVLLGGAIALAPVFAQEILHTGPVGLGLLRSAPAVGALLAGVMIARRPLRTNAGTTLLVVVALFGVSMVVFGLSRWLPLSLLALAVSGFVDMISMNIRSTTVAMVTPDELRGRVLAVENVFISASNELGAFESGAAAALLTPVSAVVLGGIATIALAVAWSRFFPELSRIGRLEDLRPALP
jgi:MFS family permease